MDKFLRRCSIVIALAVLALGGSQGPASAGSDTLWRPLKIGGGGYLTGIDQSPDGSVLIIRTDTYGAYRFDAAASRWLQLVTEASMPGEHTEHDYATGVFEIRMAPSKPARLYMAYRGRLYRSDDTGASWQPTHFPKAELDPNGEFRTFGQKLAVDPVNPDVAYFGTPQRGLYRTVDGGGAWTLVSQVPVSKAAKNAEYPGIGGIVFDPAAGQADGRTRRSYAASYGNGVFQSDDAGVSWHRTKGGPDSVSHAKIAKDGCYYAVSPGDPSTIWRLRDGVWSEITPGRDSWDTIVTDPFNPARVIAVRGGGVLNVSHDRGDHWDGPIWGPKGSPLRLAPDIPWLAWTEESYMSVGDMLMDAVHPGRLWFAEGIGAWTTEFPDRPVPPATVTFTARTAGIEQLVAVEIIAPPGGEPVVASWDRPVFTMGNRDAYPQEHGPDNTKAIIGGWAIDYAATDPKFIAGIFEWGIEKSAVSSDGGRSWTPFAATPDIANRMGGDLAISTPQNMVWVASNNQPAFVTGDGGKSWSRLAIADAPEGATTGWGFAYFLNRRIVAADRVTPGTFYLYNHLRGLYRSIDGGVSWSLVFKGEIAGFSEFNAKLKAVPGKAGHLFFTSGPQSGTKPADTPLRRSSDGGQTWSTVPGVQEVHAIGFGKARQAGSYPSVYIAGWVRRVYGIWRSDDDCVSWQQIGPFPLGSLDDVRTIDADKDVYGRVYVGFAGSGYVYGEIAPQ